VHSNGVGAADFMDEEQLVTCSSRSAKNNAWKQGRD
jgi:hypothetical protein